MQQLDFSAMGSQMRAVLADDSVEGAVLLRLVPAWFEEWEEALSRFRPWSELSRLNRRPGHARRVSLPLWQVTLAALHAARQSDGLVDPTLLDALEAAGYDRTFEAISDSGTTPERQDDNVASRSIHPTARVGAWRRIVCDQRRRTVRLAPGLRLDLGGVAKGWAADQAVRRLGVRGAALVDAGGDIAANAPPPGLPGWPVGVADPRSARRQIATLRLARGGVATSGRDYRRWQAGGIWQHHLIDPRTGRPAETDVLSATVVAPTAEQAEMAAKVVLLLGSQRGLAWIEARRALAGLVVTERGHCLFSQRLHTYLWE